MQIDGEKPDKITRGACANNDDKVIFESPLDKPGASSSRSSAYSCMHVTCYEALPYLANSKVGRSFRDPQANAYAKVSRLTSIDAASSDVESL